MARPRQFSEADLLDAATELFWTKGFDGTSVEDVSRASGIGNGSIYGAYGSKRGLFLAVFERYCEGRARFIRDTVVAVPGSARTAIQVLLRAVIDDCAAYPDRRGCLMINSLAQLGTRIPEVAAIGAKTTTAMEHAVAERLRPTSDADAADLPALSANIIVVAQGLIQLSRLGTTPERLRAIADVSCAALPGAWVDEVA